MYHSIFSVEIQNDDQKFTKSYLGRSAVYTCHIDIDILAGLTAAT